jgi:hypothetical protein
VDDVADQDVNAREQDVLDCALLCQRIEVITQPDTNLSRILGRDQLKQLRGVASIFREEGERVLLRVICIIDCVMRKAKTVLQGAFRILS